MKENYEELSSIKHDSVMEGEKEKEKEQSLYDRSDFMQKKDEVKAPASFRADPQIEEKISAIRSKVAAKMPPQLTSKKLNALKRSGDRKVSDHKTGSRVKATVREAGEEVDLIDEILAAYKDKETLTLFGIEREELTEKTVRSLKHKKTLDQAHILLNNHDYSDSDEMAAVKRDVVYFAEILEKYRDQKVTKENIEDVELAYKMLAQSCRHYLEEKDPTFSKGEKRYEQVYEVYMAVATEELLLTGYKDSILKENGEKTFGELIGISSGEEEAGEVQAEAEKEEAPMSKEAKRVADFFASDFSFDEHFQKYYFKSSEAKKIDDMLGKLESLPADKVQVMDLELMGNKVRLVQKSDNRLYLAEGGKLFSMGNTVPGLVAKIRESKLRNMELYSKTSVNRLLDRYAGQSSSAGEHMEIRAQLSKILSAMSRKGRKEGEGLAVNQFQNIRKEQLARYLKQIKAGRMTIAQVEAEVLAINQSTVSVEGVARAEVAELKKALALAAGEDAAQEEVEEEAIPVEVGWTKEEQAVKNMLADLIYNSETGKMDLCLNDPTAFLKEMIRKHKKAVFYLMNDRTGELSRNIMKKMSLDGMDRTLINADTIDISTVMHTSLMQIVSTLNSFVPKDSLVDEKLFYEKMESVLENKDIAGTLNDLLQGAGETINAGVKETCRIMQESVSKMMETVFSYDIAPTQKEEGELQKMRRESSRSDQGQGKFMKTVLNKYFGRVSDLDQRAMLASAMRFCKEVPELVLSDQQAISEIKRYRIQRYAGLFAHFQEGRLYRVVNEEERKAIDDYKKEKQTLRIQANLLAGLLRGAGPLLQKMMQGMPTESLPPEMVEALKDMKSNLPPIPQDQVTDAFDQMVQSSGKKISRIDQIRSLGAATVGQAFLCRIYGPSLPKEGKEVVIKLLRPEIQARMEREEPIMLECANETDRAMYLTYKGQLLTYKDEMNLTIEKDNILKGKEAYKGKKADVDTIDVVEEIPATVTSLVLEKASGTTVDRYMQELNNYGDELLDPYYSETEVNGVKQKFTKRLMFTPGKYDAKDLSAVRKKLVDKIDEAVKRRDHLINLCNVWINQAVFDPNSAFYHGDLHAGNIMIDDEKATFIDYGNVVNLKDRFDPNGDRQNYILRMMVSAGLSVYTDDNLNEDALNVFFASFNDIIAKNQDEEFNKMYTEEKKAQIKELFRDILSKGNESEAGYRISVCLLKAQELGVKLPPAIANFSQGQIRLQNTIDEFNQAIQKLKNDIFKIDNQTVSNGLNYDAKSIVFSTLQGGINDKNADQEFRKHQDSLGGVDEDTFKQALLDKTYVKQDADKNQREVDKRADFRTLYLGGFKNINSRMTDKDRYLIGLEPLVPIDMEAYDREKKARPVVARQAIEEYLKYYDEHPEEIGTAEQNKKAGDLALNLTLEDRLNSSLEMFGGYINLMMDIMNALQSVDRAKLREILDIFEKQIPLAMKIEKDVEKLHELQDAEVPDEEAIGKLADEIYKDYSTLKSRTSSRSFLISEVRKALTRPTPPMDHAEKQLVEMFAEQKEELGQKLKEQFDILKDVVKNKEEATRIEEEERKAREKAGEKLPKPVLSINFVPLKEDEKRYQEAMDKFLEYYSRIAYIQLQGYRDAMYKDAKDFNIRYVNFDNVMSGVTKENLYGDDGKISFFKLFKFASKFGSHAGFLYKAKNAMSD